MLYVAGKVIARILQEQLQERAENVLSESQCGFRKTRGCTDMIFTTHKFGERLWEHETKSFITLIVLKKVHNEVPRSAMYLELGKIECTRE